MVALRSQGNWSWEGPLGTPLGLVHWKRPWLPTTLKWGQNSHVSSKALSDEVLPSFMGASVLPTHHPSALEWPWLSISSLHSEDRQGVFSDSLLSE